MQLHNCILSVKDADGAVIIDHSLIRQHIVDHFRNLLNGSSQVYQPQVQQIGDFLPCALDADQTLSLSRPITEVEIRTTMFSLATGKALGPDGFNVDFFKANWDIIGPSITSAITNFFETGMLLKEINTTILAPVPKIPNALAMSDFRPIACCNTVYKCITKILANRIAVVLPTLISPPQSAFVKGRRISDNIMLAQELFASFHHDPYLPKCAIKVDFQKAYDTLEWGFLEVVFQAFGFPSFFTKLIMLCVSSPFFSISINGELHGFFGSSRGIR
ncbi:uncharacterized protein LOC125313674 [Rhodamnia argentea]|uniref:Uncharacterized protein LOC125313674 n=1 Tax=Rhodamnia argentea TaxID=178133 RepID=A0ABM3GYN9_9MYRT|nr:uncharacterized protein LOC125313674 [Rhodamnia argentea]